MGHFFGYGAILQVIALVHYARRRPDGYWIWIIFFGGGLGAAAYLLADLRHDAALHAGLLAAQTDPQAAGDGAREPLGG
jgi:hypothetical protein